MAAETLWTIKYLSGLVGSMVLHYAKNILIEYPNRISFCTFLPVYDTSITLFFIALMWLTINPKLSNKRCDCFYKDTFQSLNNFIFSFKWVHLTEQLTYEQKVEQQRMRAEISQAKREAAFFADQVAKGEHLRKLEEKVDNTFDV